MTDRRAYDPYAPAPPPEEDTDTEQAQTTGDNANQPDSSAGDNLDNLTKVELIRIAHDLDVSMTGTKAELIARIRRARGES